MDKRLDRMECHSLANQSLNIVKGLNENIKQLHSMLEVRIGVKDDTDNEGNRVTKEDVNAMVESLSNKTRSSKRKRDTEDSLDDIQLMSDAVETMEKLELKAIKLVKDTLP